MFERRWPLLSRAIRARIAPLDRCFVGSTEDSDDSIDSLETETKKIIGILKFTDEFNCFSPRPSIQKLLPPSPPHKYRPKAVRILEDFPSISLLREDSRTLVYEGWDGWLGIFGFDHIGLLGILFRFFVECNFGLSWYFAASGYMEAHEIRYAFGPNHVKHAARLKIFVFYIFFGASALLLLGVCTRKYRYFFGYCLLHLLNLILLIGTYFAVEEVEHPEMTQFYVLSYARRLERNELEDVIMNRFRRIQRAFTCCGSFNYDDYRFEALPPTCCHKNDNGSACLRSVHKQNFHLNRVGCWGPIHAYILGMLIGGHTHQNFAIFCLMFFTGIYLFYVWESSFINYEAELQRELFQQRTTNICMDEPRVTKSELKNPDLMMDRYANYVIDRDEEMASDELNPGGVHGRQRLVRLVGFSTSLQRDWHYIKKLRRFKYMKVLLRVLETVNNLDDYLLQFEVICSYYETITDVDEDEFFVPYYMAGIEPRIPEEYGEFQ